MATWGLFTVTEHIRSHGTFVKECLYQLVGGLLSDYYTGSSNLSDLVTIIKIPAWSQTSHSTTT